MLKKTINYTDFDGNPATEVAEFHVSRSQLLENYELKDDFEEMQKTINAADPEADVDPKDVRKILHLVRKLMELGYGIRSEDGKRFSQDPQHWAEFKDTAAFEALLWSLFENHAEGLEFIQAMMPADLRAEVEDSKEYQEIRKQLEESQPAKNDPAEETPEQELARLRSELANKA